MAGIWAQPLAAQLALASLIMLVLVGMIIGAIRRFGNTQEATLRMRQVRLSVSNQAIIDADRRLIVVRRDDVEHVLLIGGGHNDLVVERSIVRDWPPAPSDGDRLLQTEPTCQAPRSADLTVEDAVDFPLQPDAESSTRSLRDILRSLPDE
jgi:Flagellar biosynthesis protein, FliO